MALSNKVSLVFSYFDDVRSGFVEGLVRYWFVKSVGSLRILAVGVFI